MAPEPVDVSAGVTPVSPAKGGTVLSPAERYAASRMRASHPAVSAFRAQLSFELDPFQVEGCIALEEGESVLVAAPLRAGTASASASGR